MLARITCNKCGEEPEVRYLPIKDKLECICVCGFKWEEDTDENRELKEKNWLISRIKDIKQE